MKNQPISSYVSNDVVQTPEVMAKQIISFFSPTGKILEPCRGEGNFFNNLPHGTDWCEISENKDFMDYHDPVNWIITNPPWSKITDFLDHSMEVADNIVFLVTVNHIWTAKRQRIMREKGYGIRHILLLKWPPKSSGFPRSGFQLGAIHIQKGWKGKISVKEIK